MACPFMNKLSIDRNNFDDNHMTYAEYLKLETLLGCTETTSEVHDEHLFIINHQVSELWFKQILFDMDKIMNFLTSGKDVERHFLKINTYLRRIVSIQEMLLDQIKLMETMPPLEFADFRENLKTSSGFQSSQFRLIENKLGVKKEDRIKYNKNDYTESLHGKNRTEVVESENQTSLREIINAWLESDVNVACEVDQFWELFKDICRQWFMDEKQNAANELDEVKKIDKLNSYQKIEACFQQIFNKELYEDMVSKSYRSMSWGAFKGALMIYYKRNNVQFHGHYEILKNLMDLENATIKWRSAHILLVQRQIGCKAGTGGSSGYHYLRTTISDRYRPFLDLFLLSNYIIPHKYSKNIY